MHTSFDVELTNLTCGNTCGEGRVSWGQPCLPSIESGVPSLLIFGGSLVYIYLHPLMQNYQIRRGNTYGEGHVFSRSATPLHLHKCVARFVGDSWVSCFCILYLVSRLMRCKEKSTRQKVHFSIFCSFIEIIPFMRYQRGIGRASRGRSARRGDSGWRRRCFFRCENGSRFWPSRGGHVGVFRTSCHRRESSSSDAPAVRRRRRAWSSRRRAATAALGCGCADASRPPQHHYPVQTTPPHACFQQLHRSSLIHAHRPQAFTRG